MKYLGESPEIYEISDGESQKYMKYLGESPEIYEISRRIPRNI